MSHERFDDLARALARATSRRQVLRVLGAGLVGTLAGTLGLRQAETAQAALQPGQCRNQRDCASPEDRCCRPRDQGIGICTYVGQYANGNCGECGRHCPDGTLCCRPGAKRLEDACVNVQGSDPNNCGCCGCGCLSGQTCVNGGCV